MTVSIEKFAFGVTSGGDTVDRYRLSNATMTIDVLTFGAIISSWRCPDRHGHNDDIVLGYDSLADYENCEIYMGCVAGRFANRIAGGRFVLDGQPWQLEQNNNGHHLHGGTAGFHKQIWQARIESGTPPRLVLSLTSDHGDGGYPGNLSVEVSYQLSSDNALTISYQAVTDQPTVLNLTSHSYFNLRGHQHATENGVLDHQLQLAAQRVLAVDAESIPTGDLNPVAGTAFDFTRAAALGSRLPHQPGLYDHCYALDGVSPAAVLHDAHSGRTLEVVTSLPGMQLYTAEFVDNCAGRDAVTYGRRGSVCLEAQLFPDSPNQPAFPSATLRPGQTWQNHATYQVTTQQA